MLQGRTVGGQRKNCDRKLITPTKKGSEGNGKKNSKHKRTKKSI